MSLCVAGFILVAVVAGIVWRSRPPKRERQTNSIDAMHPTLLMAHTLANRHQKSYVLVRDLMTRGGVSIIPESRVHLDEGFEIVAVIRPIPIGEEYDPRPINWEKRKKLWRARRQRGKLRSLDEACV